MRVKRRLNEAVVQRRGSHRREPLQDEVALNA
jgi:hypothetical protein